MKAKIALTGGSGLLGATLIRSLSKAYDTVALGSDITSAAALQREIAEVKPGWIVHTTAMTDVAACEKDPEKAFAVNAEGTHNVIAGARAIGARVIAISTASVFSGLKGDYTERDVPEPENAYNTSKVKGEEYVAAYEKGTILRLNLIGIHPDGSRGKNFMEWLYDSAKTDKDIPLFDDVYINPLSNWTIASIIKDIIRSDIQEKILHIASSDVRSKAEIGGMVIGKFPRYSRKISHMSVDSIKDGVRRPKQMWLNCDYTKTKLGRSFPTISEEIDTIFHHEALNG